MAILLFCEVQQCFMLDLWQTTQVSTNKLPVYAYNTWMGNSKFNVSDTSTLFFPDFLRAQNMVWVIEGKII